MGGFISGIQQIGIGVQNAGEGLCKYAQRFGMNALVFRDEAEAALMTRYTGGQIYRREAALSLNMQGGGGFEIWQFRNREPARASAPPRLGDLGIYACKLKCTDVAAAVAGLRKFPDLHICTCTSERGNHAWVQDEWGNSFQLIEGRDWFRRNGSPIGGVCGAVIGVRSLEEAEPFYRLLLQPDEVETFTEGPVKHTVLRRKRSCQGAFGKLLGEMEVELVERSDIAPQKIFGQRFWGDCGFIHLCFDVLDMDGLKKTLESAGYPFTVDSGQSFGMEAAAGRFAYVEDPDGTLIELVETHRVPVLKKWGWYLDLRKRGLERPLPDWTIRLLGLNRVR